MHSYHEPVLKEEVLRLLELRPGDHAIDGTVGDGGHAEMILEATAPDGRLMGIDLDPEAIKTAQKRLARFGKRLDLVRGSFRDLKIHAQRFPAPRALLLDLGLRTFELESSGRGFTFQKDEPLLMRFAGEGEPTAATIINTWPRNEIERVIREYGEERYSLKISEAIVAARRKKRILTSGQLAEIVASAVSRGYERGRIHPATRTFQAIRIAVNDELEALHEVVPQALEVLAPGGRLAIISFHSLEDRIVKRAFRQAQDNGRGIIITKKPVVPSETEVNKNPKSRSAKLRVFQKK
ncbi:16S rRNA (cytosine(1402)-N(4))-methyltransferase [Candidatus Uhrbacteria bacterium RIFCSPHIGHO2_12_FULL_57_11]|uniref:Ribosomal RNA small subunit methyltransferase H n=2 Tax=Candidatus Uhriibacteriota TaxID=1752732 RepID=A0A1F7UMA4_9BACT|nr:MAG: 16S rRNA (cytosine(1402)-N(4))-methyltransferase [Candidatus Uhrbacteria bacterium RIFCSPHIGHO2_02_FULL_57_19]OGL79389.1 MAG: 16S rRNA (cytosine(1402)-N(4))-methyltransferase [Candidatus Uhrbacteria bacterium RIFCSPHIGHO2_12_FULL_57_11]